MGGAAGCLRAGEAGRRGDRPGLRRGAPRPRDREDEDAKDIARVNEDEDGRVSPPPPPAPVVQRQASDSQAALFDDDNFVF